MILETKLQPPSLKPNTLKRERLLKLLKNNLERKLVVVTGDAGYGKTTLLAQVMKEEGLPSVYYDLDRGDSDLVVFCSYLVHGLEKLRKGLASRTKGLLEQGGEVGKNYELLFGTLINELVEKRKEELFFILDDYHALSEDSLVHKALDYFIDHLPDIVHVVISSRTMPPLPSLAKWRAKQDLFELTREGLRFTEEEVKALLTEVYKTVLSEEELKRVFEQTEGWITGIQLILQSAGKDGKTVKETLNGYLEANQPLFEYFANEIYSREPTEVQDFLRKSSVLDILTAEACDSIFGREGPKAGLREYEGKGEGKESEEMLRELEKRNMFFSQVGKGEYKYHRLFREYLVSLIKDEGFRKSLHLKAADYYQRKGQLEKAVEHYLEAGSYEWAGKIMAQEAEDMIDQARFATLHRWLKSMPPEVLEKQPQLLVIQGKLLLAEGYPEEAKRSYVRAMSLLRTAGPKGEHSVALTAVLYEHGVLLWRQGSYDEALKFLKKALTACPPAEERKRAGIFNLMGLSWRGLGDLKKAQLYLLRSKGVLERYRNTFDEIALEFNLGSLLWRQGETRRLFDLYRSLIERLRGPYYSGMGFAFANAARNALDLGEEVWAEQCLNQGLAVCRPYHDPRSLAAIHRGFGALYIERAQWDQASQHLEQAREGYAKVGFMKLEPSLLCELGRLYRYRGDLEKARQHLDMAREKISKDDPLEVELLSELSLLEASLGEPEKAVQSAKRCLSLARRFEQKRYEFLALLARAEGCYAKGSGREAIRWFSLALRLAKLKGYNGILVQELRRSPRLMALARKCSGEKKYLSSFGLLAEPEVPGVPNPALHEQCFGVLQLSLPGGKAVPLNWYSRKVTSLFAYLLLHRDRVCGREELMEALWPKAPLKQAEQNLYKSISQLKKTLASGLRLAGERGLARTPIILHQERGYRIAPTLAVHSDVEAFLAQWQSARASEKEGKIEQSQTGYQRCVELYRDQFLSNLGERWCEERREEYEKLFLAAILKRAEHLAGRQAYEEAIALYRRYLARERYKEDVHVELWKALKAVGRKADIQKDFKDLQRVLKKDFGENLKEETEAAFRREWRS